MNREVIMSKKTDIKRQLMIKYMCFIIFMAILFLGAGVLGACNLVMTNSSEFLGKFAKETGKRISDIIQLEIKNIELISHSPILHSLEASEHEKMSYLREIVTQYGYKEAALIDLEGQCKTTNNKEVNVRELPYFKESLKGKSFLSEPYCSLVDNGLQVAISVPIINEGQIIAILLFTKDAQKFANITNEINFGKTGTAYVVNEVGTNIINRDINKVIHKINRIEDAKIMPEYEELANITKKMIKGENGTGTYILDGKRKFVGYAPIEAKGWSVGVTVEISDMLSSIKQVIAYIMIFMGVLALGVCALTYRIAEDLSRRLSLVKGEIKRLGKGDFTLKNKKHRIMDEITEIDHTLQMTKVSLQEMIHKIQNTHKDNHKK